MAPQPLSFIPSPSSNGFHLGPLFVHVYGLMYVIGITLAVLITQRRVRNAGGDPTLVGDVALWAVPAGIIGGRIYFDITTPSQIPHVWYGVFAVWSGGLGIWGGIAAGVLVGAWRVRRAGQSVALFADAVAPALLVAQAVGRIGNYFNQELFGRPSALPWALEIQAQHRPPGYGQFATFQPTFLYELIWDLLLAAALIWVGNRRSIRPPGLFALYVASKLFGVPHLRGIASDRQFRALPRPAPELLRRRRADHRGPGLVRHLAAASPCASHRWGHRRFNRRRCGRRSRGTLRYLCRG